MQLTKAEAQLMKYLWALGTAYFKEIKDAYPEPKPATTSINTYLKRLTDKKFIDYTLHGNSRKYVPLISKEAYFADHIKGLMNNFFDNSVEKFGSFFTKDVDLSQDELLKLRAIVDDSIKQGDAKDD